MKRHLAVAVGLISAGLVIGGGSPALAATSAASAGLAPVVASPAPGWGTAQPVPGTSAASGAGLQGVSCVAGGACTAIGDYGSNTAADAIPFAITGKNGVWGAKQQLPGLAAFAPGGTQAHALDCPATGDCVIVGSYESGTAGSGSGAYAQEEIKGTWGTPVAIPGTSALDGGTGYTQPTNVTCASPGNCLLAGLYSSSGGFVQNVFIAQETGYQWSAATVPPGLAALNVEDYSGITGVSCPAAGDCVLVGSYAVETPEDALASRPFAAVESDGTWQPATEIQLPALSADGSGTAYALSCPALGKCVLAGSYQQEDTVSPVTGFVVTQTAAGWSAPVTFPGAAIHAISCPSAGNCGATADDDNDVAEVVSEVHGTWGRESALPGVAALTYQGESAAYSYPFYLVCPSAGNCTAAGTYSPSESAATTYQNVFVASEVAGTWLPARVPAGLSALNTAGYASIAGLGCTATANCVVGGNYEISAADQGAFLVAEVPR
jgi:hypothetical protein